MSNDQPRAHPDYLIEPAELADLLNNPAATANLRLFDATVEFSQQPDGVLAAAPGEASWRQAHIPGAAFFDHMGQFAEPGSPLRNTLLSIEDLQGAMGKAGIGAENLVIVYSSQYLMWATRAWWMLHHAGHSNVRVLNGGLGAWQAAGLPIETGGNAYPETHFSAPPRLQRYASKATIAAAIDGPACTIDALPAAVYEGTSRQHYGRPGHIPGATNLPYSNLQNEEAYLPAAELAAALEAQGMLGTKQVYTYCGGGIAATVAALACLICGQDNVAVYDGSMSEWSLDEGLDVKTGAAP